MNISRILTCSAFIAFMTPIGCASAPTETMVAIEVEKPHVAAPNAEEGDQLKLSPVTIRDLSFYAPYLEDLYSVDVFLSAPQSDNQTYLRHANLVPSDLNGTRDQQLDWYEANAVRVDMNAAFIFGGGSPVIDLDSYQWMLDRSLDRTPGTDPTPAP